LAFLNLESIIGRWTHCYHVTAAINLQFIRRFGTLLPAATLFRLTDRGDLLNCRRIQDVRLRLQGLEVLVRNQIPLDPGSIDVGLKETFEGYVASLNERVFFWPGTTLGPTQDGMRMFQQTSQVNSAMIRVPSRSLFDSNEGSPIHLSTCNTGASWIVNGKKSQRGPNVFQNAGSFVEPAGRIEEISIIGSVSLPDDSEYCASFGERWRSLFEAPKDQRRNEIAMDPRLGEKDPF
jgi:hypothetical protein